MSQVTLTPPQTSVEPPHPPLPGPGRSRRPALLARARRPALAGVLLVIGVVHGTNLAGWPLFTNDDEGTYYAQAWALLHKGELAHYTYWYDHPPLGWVQLAVFIEPIHWVMGSVPAVVGGRAVMVLYTLASAALIYRLALNLRIRPVLALLAPLVWALSPLVLFEGRQVFLDNMQLPWLLGALVLATNRSRSLGLHIASGVCFGVAVLTKETALLAAPAILLALWQQSYRPTRSFSLMGWSVFASFTGLTYLLYATLKNELLHGAGHVSLVDALTWQLSSRRGSGSIFDHRSAANSVLAFWLSQDRILIVSGLVAAVVCVAVRRLRPIAVLILVYLLMVVRPSGYLPAMFVVVVLPFAALAVAGALDVAWTGAARLPRADRAAMAGIAVAGLVGAALVVPHWAPRISYAMHASANEPYVEALAYVTKNVTRDNIILTDDISWNDLVQAGWPSDGFDGAVWFYKLDRDIEAKKALPRGWKDVDYVLVGRPMGLLMTSLLDEKIDPNVIAAYQNSRVVKRWGSKGLQVELRRVTPERVTSSEAPPVRTPEAPAAPVAPAQPVRP